MTYLTGLSDSEFQASAEAHQREAARRAALGQAERAEQFRRELDEVRAGSRLMGDEHVPWLTPREVEAAVNRGQVPGIAPDRRLRRGQ